jgi:hypothetical protein
MGKLINAILNPKGAGLEGATKPKAILIHSPFDTAGHAVSYTAAAKVLSDIGYGTISKAKLTFDKADNTEFDRAIRETKIAGEQLTLWMESHGAPGWLFGCTRDHKNEFQWAKNFALFVRAVECYTGTTINNIVLSGCFTANEFIDESAETFLLSPARMLSLLLPEKSIVGFVGQNAVAKVSNVFYKTTRGEYEPQIVNLDQAAVLFHGGRALESYHDTKARPLYCSFIYTPEFIIKQTGLSLRLADRARTFYEPCLALETLEAHAKHKTLYVAPDCYGYRQLSAARKAAPHLSREALAATAEAQITTITAARHAASADLVKAMIAEEGAARDSTIAKASIDIFTLDTAAGALGIIADKSSPAPGAMPVTP